MEINFYWRGNGSSPDRLKTAGQRKLKSGKLKAPDWGGGMTGSTPATTLKKNWDEKGKRNGNFVFGKQFLREHNRVTIYRSLPDAVLVNPGGGKNRRRRELNTYCIIIWRKKIEDSSRRRWMDTFSLYESNDHAMPGKRARNETALYLCIEGEESTRWKIRHPERTLTHFS